MAALPLRQDSYTYADICAMRDDIRRELIDGVIYNMAAPTNTHQAIAMEISRQLGNFLKGRKCKVYFSPFDVRLNADEGDDTVVQPDILVICDPKILDPKDRGCRGAPDLVVEVLSKSTAYMDRHVKFKKYLEAGVKEYWIVDPMNQYVDAHILENGKYNRHDYYRTDILPVHVLEGCEIDLSEVFEEDEF